MRRLIHGGKFKDHPISQEALQFPAMLGEEERRVLAYLASNLASEKGKIVDLGCYLGGSTRALTDGVRQADLALDPDDPIVVSYDLFRANQFMVDHSLKHFGIGVGEPFQPIFRQLLGENAPLVREVAGDILWQRWDGRPIDLLFVDILWTWEINQHVISQFYTALVPERSVIAHQDYIYSFYPWLPISMEYLAENGFVEFGDLAKWGTVVFGVTKSLDDDAASIDFRRDLSLDSKERLLIRSSERFEGYPRGIMELSRVVLLASENRRDDAVSLLRDIDDRYAEDEFVETHLKMVYQHLDLPRYTKQTKADPPQERKSPWKALGQMLARSSS
jgi:hypothetical protein